MTNLTNLVVKKSSRLSGAIKAPSSKSLTHRALIAASLSEGPSKITDALICDDTLATINACRLLGAEIEKNGEETYVVHGKYKPATPAAASNRE